MIRKNVLLEDSNFQYDFNTCDWLLNKYLVISWRSGSYSYINSYEFNEAKTAVVAKMVSGKQVGSATYSTKMSDSRIYLSSGYYETDLHRIIDIDEAG